MMKFTRGLAVVAVVALGVVGCGDNGDKDSDKGERSDVRDTVEMDTTGDGMDAGRDTMDAGPGDVGKDGGETSPSIAEFTADPSSIVTGESSTLSWTIEGSATSLAIAPGVGDVTGETSVMVTPDETTTYTLTASNAAGSASRDLEVQVDGNEAPVVENLSSDQSIVQNTVEPPAERTITFTISDGVPAAHTVESLQTSVASTNSDWIPADSLSRSCADDGSCELTVEVPRGEAQSTDLEITVEDPAGASTTKTVGIEVAPRGVSSAMNAGSGTLREVVGQADPGDVIGFGPLGGNTITLSQQIEIDKVLSIVGSGSGMLTIQSNSSDNNRHFEVLSGGDLTLSGVTLSDGNPDSSVGNPGGGAILNKGALSLSQCALTNNTSTTVGGAILNTGSASLTVDACTIANNSAAYVGGGINHKGQSVTIKNSIFRANSITAGGTGGGFSFASGTGTVRIVNSTFTGNSTSGPPGDAISCSTAGTLEIVYSTIVANSVSHSAVSKDDAGCTMTLKSSIIAANGGADLWATDGTIGSGGYNVYGNLRGSTTWSGITGSNIQTNDPQLGSLADNGGVTQTIKPTASSPVVDAIPSGDCTDLAGNTMTRDQRGESRPHPAGGACDVGSVERQ